MQNEDIKTILLVEDEACTSRMQQIILEKHGYKVISALSGEKAVNIAETVPELHLVLMDINLGDGIDGIRAAELILEKRDLPLIFLSSTIANDIAEKMTQINSYGFIAKPSGDALLISNINIALRLFNTQQKAKLRESELRLKNYVFDSSIAAISIADLDGNITEANDIFLKTWGYQDRKEVIGRSIPHFLKNPEDAQVILSALDSSGTWEGEYTALKKDGSTFDAHGLATTLRDKGCRKIGYQSSVLDITERKRTEKLIKIERDLGMSLAEAASLKEALGLCLDAAISMSDMDSGGVYLINDSCEMDLILHKGLSDDFIRAASHYDADSTNSRIARHCVSIYLDSSGLSSGGDEKARTEIMTSYAAGGKQKLLFQNEGIKAIMILPVCIQGKPLACLNIASHTEKVIPLHTRIALESITSHIASAILKIKIHDQLIERESRFRSFFNMPLIGFAITSPEKGWIDVNNQTCDILGYSKDELLRLTWSELTHPDDLAADVKKFESIVSGEIENYSLDKRFIRKDGSIVWTSLGVGCVRKPDRSILYIVALLNDITERKNAEDKINTLLEEKELILKEVHHRIKNNLSTIISLLQIQAREMKESEATDVLKNTAQRIRGMTILYDKLYQSNNSSSISSFDYLHSLTDEILCNFPNSTSVKIEKKIENFPLHANKIQPLGIIINELLTNTMKYAFREINDGLIAVTAVLKGSRVTLTIADNGHSMPESIDFENSPGFGLKLVSLLTKQLNGTIRIERGNGTRIVLEFNV